MTVLSDGSSAVTDFVPAWHEDDPDQADDEPLYWHLRAKLGYLDLLRFREMYLAGAPTPEICQALSISPTGVSNYARRLNLPLRRKREPLTGARRARFHELYFAGVVFEEICRELGMTQQTLGWHVRQMGLPGRRRAGAGNPRHPNGKLSEAEVAALGEMYEAGVPVAEIRARLSIGLSSVYRYAAKLRLRRPARTRRSRTEPHGATAGEAVVKT